MSLSPKEERSANMDDHQMTMEQMAQIVERLEQMTKQKRHMKGR